MPNLWAHIIFGEQVLIRIDQEKLISNPNLKQIYNLGCQGPDFLLYHNFYPWKKETRVADLGQLIHTRRCGQFLMEMIKHIAASPKDDPTVIYTMGFITHYVLDTHVHPYVFARSGYEKWKHQRFEVMMDTIIAQQLKDIATWKEYAWKQIYVGKHLPASIVELFQQVTGAVFPEEHATMRLEDWDEAYRHIIQAHRLFRDPYGIKRVLLMNQTDPFIYKRKLPPIDVLNVSREAWAHPSDDTEIYTDSVWDLWEVALHEASNIFSQLISLLDGASGEQQFANLAEKIGDNSYDCGKPSDGNFELLYSAPII